MSRPVLCGIVMALVALAPAAGDVTLVRDGEPVATIVHLGQPGCDEAADELQRYIHAISGAVLEIRRMSPQEMETAYFEGRQLLAVAVGEQTARQFGLDVPPLQANGFHQMCDGAGLLGVLGKDPEGLLYGVYDLLEQLGVRWYMPTELGEHVPTRETIRVGWLQNTESPDFILRSMWLAYSGRPEEVRNAYATWQRRNKMGGVRASMGHNLARIIPPERYAETHPEYFPLIDGERMIPTEGHSWQPCTSNEDVIRIAAEAARRAFDESPDLWSYSLSPNDGWGGWCECEACVAQDPPEFRGNPRHGKGRRMLVFANRVAELLEETHPDRHVCFYAYAPTAEPPTDLQAHPQVAVAVAHYGGVSDKLRPITDPDSPRNPGYIPIVEGWAEVTDTIFAREYYTGLLDEMDGLARVAAAWALAEDIPWYRDHNVVGISSEALAMWGTCGLNFYLAGRLMWDADADVEAILDDYFEGMYGLAAQPMREYFETLRDIARERYLKSKLFTEEDFPPLRALLDEAMGMAETDKQRGRIQLAIDHFEYVQLLRQMQLTGSEEAIAALDEFVVEHPDTWGFDQTLHRRSIKAPRQTTIPRDLRYDGPPVIRASDGEVPAEALERAPAVRHGAVYLILPEPGAPFAATIAPRKLGRYLDPTAVSLLGPDGEEVASATVGPLAEETLTVDSAADGTYQLLVNAGANAARVTCDAAGFVLAGRDQSFVGATPRMYFLPDPDADQVAVIMDTDAPGETAALTVFGPDGEELGAGHTGEDETVRLTIEPSAERPLSLQASEAPEGYLEDVRVELRGALPYLATHPARLVRLAQ